MGSRRRNPRHTEKNAQQWRVSSSSAHKDTRRFSVSFWLRDRRRLVRMAWVADRHHGNGTMTPSEKLDAILAAGQTPRIQDVVDCKRYKYVWGGEKAIRVGDWLVYIPHGLLSDGASCVPDRLPEAFFAHDRLYLSPWAYYRGVRKRLTRRQCDMMYLRIGLRRRVWLVVLEGAGLVFGAGRKAWNDYRSQNEDTLIESHTVPRAACWQLISNRTTDAEWIG